MVQPAGERLAQAWRRSHCPAGLGAGPAWIPPVLQDSVAPVHDCNSLEGRMQAIGGRGIRCVDMGLQRFRSGESEGLAQHKTEMTYESEDQSSAAVEPGVYRGKDGLARIVHPAILVVEQVARWRKTR